jgi:hypothetical protein
MLRLCNESRFAIYNVGGLPYNGYIGKKSKARNCLRSEKTFSRMCLTYGFSSCIIEVSTKVGIKKQHKPFGRKEIQMPEIKVGDRYETKTNKFVGVVQEIAQNKNGSFRVRLDIDGKAHWTSAQGTVLA